MQPIRNRGHCQRRAHAVFVDRRAPAECRKERTNGNRYKPVDVPGTAAPRFRINNLWGTHLRYDAWAVESGGDMRDSRVHYSFTIIRTTLAVDG